MIYAITTKGKCLDPDSGTFLAAVHQDLLVVPVDQHEQLYGHKRNPVCQCGSSPGLQVIPEKARKSFMIH
eukprot:1424270-Rhodomonas_salina.5